MLVLPDAKIVPRASGRVTATVRTTRAQLGLPYYGGIVRYHQRFNVPVISGKKFRLTCAGLAGTGAAIRVNGVPCGLVLWAPDAVDVTRAVRRGVNLVELDLRGSPVVLTGRIDPTRLGCRVKLEAL